MITPAAELLERNIGKIMQLWEQRARAEVKAAPDQNAFALRDALPDFLKRVAAGLCASPDKVPSSGSPDADHGRLRAENADYTIDQVIQEYHILRQVIFEVLEENYTLTVPDRNYLFDSIGQAVSDAATEFSSYLKNLQESFSRTLIHDLRSPLSIAMLSARMIQSEGAYAENNKRVQQRIARNLDRIDGMIYRLLDYSLIKAGQKLNLKIHEFDLIQLIENLVADFNSSPSEQLVLEAPKELLGYWDHETMLSVLENLATNAMKYGDYGGPVKITVNTVSADVQISVHNLGKEISADDQKIIFQEFRRSKSAESKPGWGLGLMSAKSIVEAHGGSITVESLPVKGTTFLVQLPLDSRKAH